MGAYSGSSCAVWLLVPVPDGLDSNVAATIPLDYLTQRACWSDMGA